MNDQSRSSGNQAPEAGEGSTYEPPMLVEIGDFAEHTQGSGNQNREGRTFYFNV